MSGINLALISLPDSVACRYASIGISEKGQNFLKEGLFAQGHIYATRLVSGSAATVFYYSYYAIDGKQYTGRLTAASNKFKCSLICFLLCKFTLIRYCKPAGQLAILNAAYLK